MNATMQERGSGSGGSTQTAPLPETASGRQWDPIGLTVNGKPLASPQRSRPQDELADDVGAQWALAWCRGIRSHALAHARAA